MAWLNLREVPCPRCGGCLAWDSTQEAHCLLCGHRLFAGFGRPFASRPSVPTPHTHNEKISAGLRAKYYQRKDPVRFMLLIVGSLCLPV